MFAFYVTNRTTGKRAYTHIVLNVKCKLVKHKVIIMKYNIGDDDGVVRSWSN